MGTFSESQALCRISLSAGKYSSSSLREVIPKLQVGKTRPRSGFKPSLPHEASTTSRRWGLPGELLAHGMGTLAVPLTHGGGPCSGQLRQMRPGQLGMGLASSELSLIEDKLCLPSSPSRILQNLFSILRNLATPLPSLWELGPSSHSQCGGPENMT